MSKTPKLRFKEFSGDWEENELGNIVEISKGKYNPLKSEENYKCIELENLSQETGQLLGYFNSKEQQSIKNKFNKGQVLFGKLRPYLKKYWLADFEGVCSSEIWVLNGKSVSNNFIYRIIQTDKFNFISNISSGSKMPRADWNYMSEFPFFTPSIEEQEKIASLFSLIDDKISLQGEKLKMLKDYKKGMMQKIFSRELRFKYDDGRDYPEWEVTTIENIANLEK
ncbi:MAG: restriction endonuclease subunit S, partial [Peptostreptococcaceae bacterium]|nr:restriction endonuclease subunit S [Peptostreptococcaceae bacterium]